MRKLLVIAPPDCPGDAVAMPGFRFSASDSVDYNSAVVEFNYNPADVSESSVLLEHYKIRYMYVKSNSN